MKLFIQANHYKVWRIITNGPSIPIKRVEGVQLNEKAMHTLFFALGSNVYNRLEVTHEGKSRVKESKISLLTLDYALFKAKSEEGINEMSDRFTHIINEESKDFNSLSIDELISSLLTYEMKINHNTQEIKEAPKKDENSSNYNDDEQMAIFAGRFKRFMRSNKGRQFQKKAGLKIESTNKKYPIICHKCKKLGHIKFDCP
ncbi:hypothetical protein V6Z12_A01G149100 [Gossypium hirsutum]